MRRRRGAIGADVARIPPRGPLRAIWRVRIAVGCLRATPSRRG